MFIIIVFATRHRPHPSLIDYPFPDLDIRIRYMYMPCYVSVFLGGRGGGYCRQIQLLPVQLVYV